MTSPYSPYQKLSFGCAVLQSFDPQKPEGNVEVLHALGKDVLADMTAVSSLVGHVGLSRGELNLPLSPFPTEKHMSAPRGECCTARAQRHVSSPRPGVAGVPIQHDSALLSKLKLRVTV